MEKDTVMKQTCLYLSSWSRFWKLAGCKEAIERVKYIHLFYQEDPGEVEGDVGGECEEEGEGDKDVPEPPKKAREGTEDILENTPQVLEMFE